MYLVVFYDSEFIFPYEFITYADADNFIDKYHLHAYITIAES